MQQKIHPGIAAVIILVFLGIVGFVLWWPNRPRPIPDHFGPMTPGQAMQIMHGGSPASAPPAPVANAEAKAKAATVKAKDTKGKDNKPASN